MAAVNKCKTATFGGNTMRKNQNETQPSLFGGNETERTTKLQRTIQRVVELLGEEADSFVLVARKGKEFRTAEVIKGDTNDNYPRYQDAYDLFTRAAIDTTLTLGGPYEMSPHEFGMNLSTHIDYSRYRGRK